MPTLDSLRMDRIFAHQSRPTATQANAVLIERAKALETKDRQLIELWLAGNLSVRQIGRIIELPPGTVSRRMRRLCARLGDPLVVALLDPACPLPEKYRDVAIAHFAQCHPMREVARDRDMTRAQVSDILHFVRGWFRAVHLHSRHPVAAR